MVKTFIDEKLMAKVIEAERNANKAESKANEAEKKLEEAERKLELAVKNLMPLLGPEKIAEVIEIPLEKVMEIINGK